MCHPPTGTEDGFVRVELLPDWRIRNKPVGRFAKRNIFTHIAERVNYCEQYVMGISLSETAPCICEHNIVIFT